MRADSMYLKYVQLLTCANACPRTSRRCERRSVPTEEVTEDEVPLHHLITYCGNHTTSSVPPTTKITLIKNLTVFDNGQSNIVSRRPRRLVCMVAERRVCVGR